jgi:hypothetical protein
MLISVCGYNSVNHCRMKFACHKAKALSRVAITIFVGMDELGIYITMRRLRDSRLPFILTRPVPAWPEAQRGFIHLRTTRGMAR